MKFAKGVDMNVILMKILFVLICGLLKWVGERFNHNAQRFVLPVLGCLMLFLMWKFNHPIIMFTPLLGIVAIVLGYKFYGKSDFWDRFCWLMTAEIMLWVGCLISNHIHPWWVYLILCSICGIEAALLRNKNNNWVSPITGGLLGCIIFWVK